LNDGLEIRGNFEWVRFAYFDFSIVSDLGSELTNLLKRIFLKISSGLASEIYPICGKCFTRD
jgi:hypothetical protein